MVWSSRPPLLMSATLLNASNLGEGVEYWDLPQIYSVIRKLLPFSFGWYGSRLLATPGKADRRSQRQLMKTLRP